MTVTQPNAGRLYFSAPVGQLGPHFDRVQNGSDESTVVSIAASWVANPTLTEADLRQLERDERTFREYGAIPARLVMALPASGSVAF
jgi:hypothetical protein